jgi:hypothetical protein
MKQKVRLKKAVLILSALFLAAAVLSVSSALYDSGKLEGAFQAESGAYQYADAAAGGKIDLSKISELYPSIEAAPGFNSINELEAPVSICYYKSLGDKAPAYVVDRGSKILVKADGSVASGIGYGIFSLPGNTRGWRIAKPFAGNGLPKDNNLYYVKLSDLQAVAGAWVDLNPGLVGASLENHTLEKIYLFFYPAPIEKITLSVDRVLYDRGVFLSPDLRKPIFSVPACGLLFLSLFGFACFLRLREDEKEK